MAVPGPWPARKFGAVSGYVPVVRTLLPRRPRLDPVELPPPELIALLFFAVAAGLLLTR